MKTIGKLSLILLAVFIISSILAILTGPVTLIPQGFESANVYHYEKSSLTGVNVLEVITPDADVNVYPVKGKEFEINLTGTYAENKYGSNVNLSVEKIGNTVEVKVIYPNMNFVLINRDFNLYVGVPENYLGEIKILSASGDIEINNLKTKEFEVNTASGDIKINNLTSERAFIESVSGDIYSKNLEIEESAFRSVSGDIEIIDSQNIDSVKTTSGNIQITNYFLEKNLDIESVSGDVKIDLIDYSSVDIKFESVSGDLQNDFGTVYSGKNKVYVKTTSGDLRIY